MKPKGAGSSAFRGGSTLYGGVSDAYSKVNCSSEDSSSSDCKINFDENNQLAYRGRDGKEPLITQDSIARASGQDLSRKERQDAIKQFAYNANQWQYDEENTPPVTQELKSMSLE